MTSIVESLCDLADRIPADYAGSLSVHTDKIKTVGELAAWCRCLDTPRVHHVGDRTSWVDGNVGKIMVLVNYERGLLGEPVPKPAEPLSVDKSTAALTRLLTSTDIPSSPTNN